MFRSFTYARRTGMQRCTVQSAEDCSRWDSLLEKWESDVRQHVRHDLRLDRATGGTLSITGRAAQPLLTLFEVEKALYETRYELGNRPDWASIPLRSLIAFTQSR